MLMELVNLVNIIKLVKRARCKQVLILGVESEEEIEKNTSKLNIPPLVNTVKGNEDSSKVKA